MLALVSDFSSSQKVVIKEVVKPDPGEGELLIRVKAVALNHRDQWIREGKYPNIREGVIMGSDGSGVIEKTGSAEDHHLTGKEVVINPNIDWGENPAVQSAGYRILGMPENGTFSEYAIVKKDRIHSKPAHLTYEQAAALPLGGLTAYRALFYHGKLAPGQNVLINGIGGGVAQFAFLFAKTVGAKVYVTSGSSEKLNSAVSGGAVAGFNYKEQDWPKEAAKQTGGFHLIIDSAGGSQMNNLIKLTKPAGRIVFYGATTGLPENIDLYRVFWNQITLQGSTMGNDDEFVQMLNFIEKHGIEPVIDSVRPFSKIIEALDDMKNGRQNGKIVLTFQ